MLNLDKLVICSLASMVLFASSGFATDRSHYIPSSFPNGVASGDTTSTSTVLWTRSLTTGKVRFEISRTRLFLRPIQSHKVKVADPTVPVKVEIKGLTPGTTYYYRVTNKSRHSIIGKFRTAASSRKGSIHHDKHGKFSYLWQRKFRPLRFGISGDWRGELAPYPAVKNVHTRNLDFFVTLGDTIYADFPSPAVSQEQAETLEEFRLKHDEVYTQRLGFNAWARVRQSTSIFTMIDDHEVTNDFAGGAPPSTDPRFSGPGDFINETELYRNGLQAFHEFNPIQKLTYNTPESPLTDGKPVLYRNQSYGKSAAIFLLDARSFRDTELEAVANPFDSTQVGAFIAQSFDIDPLTGQSLPARSMLSTPQLDFLKEDLIKAEEKGITWKFVMVPEPVQNLGVIGAPDRFEGYARERTELLKFIEDNQINNVVFVAADIHGTLVNNLTYQLGPGQPQIETSMFEITTGSVAFDAPFGPSVLDIAAATTVAPGVTLLDSFLSGLGLPNRQAFEALPLAQRDLALQGLIDEQIIPLGYDPIGLQDSMVHATLLEGGYTAVHTFGWTEFEIRPISKKLVITTYGIDPYTEDEIDTSILDRDPQVISKFEVLPQK